MHHAWEDVKFIWDYPGGFPLEYLVNLFSVPPAQFRLT